MEISLNIKDNPHRGYLIVEGESDRRLFETYFRKRGIEVNNDLNIIAASNIEVDETVLRRNNLRPHCNKDLIIAFALFCNSENPVIADNIRCIVDKDCWESNPYDNDALIVVTDYPAIESYAFDASIFDDLRILFDNKIPSGDVIVEQMKNKLCYLFSLRKKYSGPADTLPPISYKNVGKEGDFIRNCTNNLCSNSDVKEIFDSLINKNPKSFAYGHDIAQVFKHLYKSKAPNKNIHFSDLELHMLRQLVFSQTLDSERMFLCLNSWLKSIGCFI
ncbi:hypothetical protein EMB92_06195 [Bifidobacterium callitrichos]|uniref:DUF4435 domain-containing protein n=1 Tax=Bifidobacterium callitrichos TaxID=762209 RepID=A0A5M9ZCT0_9BIFI|nr:hypothetical protein [Bifidobacterium callitrichos]KAA8816491.1 hypothetical protein EMB92_06195 [Bifidobacterium callitrichos]